MPSNRWEHINLRMTASELKEKYPLPWIRERCEKLGLSSNDLVIVNTRRSSYYPCIVVWFDSLTR